MGWKSREPPKKLAKREQDDEVEEGGPSQDEYESDFINDGEEEEEVEIKGHSEEEYFSKSPISRLDEDESKDEDDIYDKLSLAPD
jgi:SNF2 family DNA or RNA helicase